MGVARSPQGDLGLHAFPSFWRNTLLPTVGPGAPVGLLEFLKIDSLCLKCYFLSSSNAPINEVWTSQLRVQ